MFKLIDITKLTSSYRYSLIIETLSKWFKKSEQIVDIGSGNGIVIKLIMDHFNVKIIASDIKNYLIYDDIYFVKIKNGKLPFQAKQFDIALLLDVLHHVSFKKQELLIKESLRVAKKVFIFDAKPTLAGKVADLILNKYHYGDLEAPLTFRDVQNWTKLFNKMSLKSQVISIKRPFWYPFSHVAFLIRKPNF